MHPLYVGLVLVIITYITHTSYAFTGLLTYPSIPCKHSLVCILNIIIIIILDLIARDLLYHCCALHNF